jgi:shikimate dehydrogenase
MADRYAVIGNPVDHSLSPDIHAAFARETAQDISYVRLAAPLDGFKAAVAKFRDEGGSGLNVTLPFKHEAWSLSVAQGAARAAKAVNTLKLGGTEILGYNTDGVGLVRDLLANQGCPVRGLRVLLLGAGGATYGVVEPLLAERPAQLIVANRTPQKARDLVAHFSGLIASARQVAAAGYDELRGSQFDIVINATSAGLAGAMPPLPERVFAPGALAYDMVYGKETPFLKFAAQRGARAIDGLGMLVEQAAESFFIWRGVRPSTAPVIRALRRKEEGRRKKEEGG